MPKKKNSQRKAASLPFFFFCVCVCVILSLQCDMSGNISLCSPHTQQTQQTMNGRGECLLDACECITSVKKKKEMVVVFLLSFSSTWQAHAHYSSFVFFFFTVSSFNSLYLVQCFALFFFFASVCRKALQWFLVGGYAVLKTAVVYITSSFSFFLCFSCSCESKQKKKKEIKQNEGKALIKKKKEGDLIIVVENNRWTTQSFRRLQPPTHAHRHECFPPHITAYTSCQHCTL